MSNDPSYFEELISDLKRQRDELRLQLHLGSEELKEKFSELDDRIAQMSHRMEPLKDAVGETASDLWESLKLMGGEVQEGFQRIRKSLK
ncbi:MAG: hypothetical protein R3E01_20240 [Pirellulaceae bacterium]